MGKRDAALDNARAFQAGTNRIGGAVYQGDAAVQIAAKESFAPAIFARAGDAGWQQTPDQ